MSTTVAFSAVFETVEDGWVQGRLVEIPGVITAAPTLAEAQEMLVDALAEYLRSFAQPAEPAATDADTATLRVVITAA